MSFFTEGHDNSDVDTSSLAQHHTLGSEENQAAPGASTNRALTNGITTAVAISNSDLVLTTQVTDTDIPGASLTILTDNSDVFLITLDCDASKDSTANDILLVSLNVDGSNVAPSIVYRSLTNLFRSTSGRTFIVTGLSGNVIFKAVARLNIAGAYTVKSAGTSLRVLKLNNLKGESIAP